MSRIPWTGRTWNPGIFGCSPVSPACDSCYAACIAHRGMGPYADYRDITYITEHGVAWTGNVHVHFGRIAPTAASLPTRKRGLVFVTSMGDLWHPQIPRAFQVQVFAEMARRPHLTFQVLTKHARRMAVRLSSAREGRLVAGWPLPNVWLGATIEDADLRRQRRLRALIDTPKADGAIRFLSIEPMLEAPDLDILEPGDVGLVILGGEAKRTRRPARPFDLDGARRVIDKARDIDAEVQVKQLGTHWARANGSSTRDGNNPSEWPDDLAALHGLPGPIAAMAGLSA